MNINSFRKMIDSNKKILVIFFTTNLFTKLNNDIEIMQKTYKNIKIINVDNAKELVFDLNLKSVPFFYIYRDNQIIEEILGNYKNICDIIKVHL